MAGQSEVLPYLNYKFRGHQVPDTGVKEAILFWVEKFYNGDKDQSYFPDDVQVLGPKILRLDYETHPNRITVCVDINRCVVDISVG
jgi:hypothetical protein